MLEILRVDVFSSGVTLNIYALETFDDDPIFQLHYSACSDYKIKQNSV